MKGALMVKGMHDDDGLRGLRSHLTDDEVDIVGDGEIREHGALLFLDPQIAVLKDAYLSMSDRRRGESADFELVGQVETAATAATFDIEERWPELFQSLDETGRTAVVNAFASSWHEGWVPNREDVENLTDFVRGAIDEAEYDRRAAGAALRHRSHRVA